MLGQIAVEFLVHLVEEVAHRSQTRHQEQPAHQDENRHQGYSQPPVQCPHHDSDSSPVAENSEKR